MRLLFAITILATLISTAHAEPVASLADGRSGKIEFQSITPATVGAFVRRAPDVPRTIIDGTLVLPPGNDKVPAMVVVHGSGGVTDAREFAWARRLNDIGVAAFIVDSFGPRNIRETATDQAQLNTIANVADALHALKLLATHPRIDRARIGVMGFSKGGQVTLWSALDTVRRGVIDDDLRFAVHAAFYPACNTQYVGKPTGAPVAIMIGASDDYTPPWACERYAAWFRSVGVTTTYTTYWGAYHGFDAPGRVQFLNSLVTGRSCDAEYNVDSGQTKRLDTNTVMSVPESAAYFKACILRGATVGGDARALSKAADDLRALLRQVFALPG